MNTSIIIHDHDHHHQHDRDYHCMGAIARRQWGEAVISLQKIIYYYQLYPTPPHQSLTSWTLTFHHSPVPPTSPTTPSVADSVYVANLRLPG